ANVPGFAASLVDAAGVTLPPSKTTLAGFTFTTHPPNPNVVLHVTAPGHVPLGGVADPGVPIGKAPGPAGVPGAAVGKQPGPPGLPDGAQFFAGLKLAILLAPSAGCPTPLRHAAMTALSGKVVDRDSGAPVTGLAVSVTPDPASPTAKNPGPPQIGNG